MGDLIAVNGTSDVLDFCLSSELAQDRMSRRTRRHPNVVVNLVAVYRRPSDGYSPAFPVIALYNLLIEVEERPVLGEASSPNGTARPR